MILKGRNALITGSGAGIGRSIAAAMARQGANVAVADINEQAACEAAAELRSYGVISKAYRVDISKTETLKAFVEDVEASLGPIDILVNNAGVTSTTSLPDMTPEEWDFVMGVNCRGTFFLSQAVFAGMLGVTLFGLLFTPVFYVVCRWLAGRRRGRAHAAVPAA